MKSGLFSLKISFTFYNVFAQLSENKAKFCSGVVSQCAENTLNYRVCGIRPIQDRFEKRFFSSMCELLKYNCQVDDSKAYLVVNEEFCEEKSPLFDLFDTTNIKKEIKISDNSSKCTYDCKFPPDNREICSIRPDGKGFRLKWFVNKCEMLKYNCEKSANFTIEAHHVCKGLHHRPTGVHGLSTSTLRNNRTNTIKSKPFRHYKENVVIVDASMFNTNGNINDTVENFFAATHLLDMPVQEVSKDIFEGETRRRLIKIAGPVVVFRPTVVIPKNVSTSYEYAPTLGSCYHKCPEKCPDTYTPVCGTPGIIAREPSLVFLNHCYMDAAQCRLKYSKESTTYHSSYYSESTFLFCMGDTMNSMYRFLPVLRTLQHMGRLKKKGYYRYKVQNMRFYNNLLLRNPNFMG